MSTVLYKRASLQFAVICDQTEENKYIMHFTHL